MISLPRLLPQPTRLFLEELYIRTNSIPNHTVHNIEEYEINDDANKFLSTLKEEIKINNNKPTTVKYGKLFENDLVWIENGKLHVKCEPTEIPCRQEFSTGLVFYVPVNHLLVASAPYSSHYSCNPITIDSITRTNMMIYIDTQPMDEARTVVFDLDLFFCSCKFKYNDSEPKIKSGGTIHNFKKCITICDFLKPTTPKVISNEVELELSNGTALLIFTRKREHRARKLPITGVYVRKDGSVFCSNYHEVHDFLMPRKIDMGSLSYSVVSKYISNVVFQEVEDAPPSANPTNGGYNGWLDIHDVTYNKKVDLFKEAHKIFHWENVLLKILKGFKIEEEGLIEKLRSFINTKKIKQFQKNIMQYKGISDIESLKKAFDDINLGYANTNKTHFERLEKELKDLQAINIKVEADEAERRREERRAAKEPVDYSEFSGDYEANFEEAKDGENKENEYEDTQTFQNDPLNLSCHEDLEDVFALEEDVDERVSVFRFPAVKRPREGEAGDGDENEDKKKRSDEAVETLNEEDEDEDEDGDTTTTDGDDDDDEEEDEEENANVAVDVVLEEQEE